MNVQTFIKNVIYFLFLFFLFIPFKFAYSNDLDSNNFKEYINFLKFNALNCNLKVINEKFSFTSESNQSKLFIELKLSTESILSIFELLDNILKANFYKASDINTISIVFNKDVYIVSLSILKEHVNLIENDITCSQFNVLKNIIYKILELYKADINEVNYLKNCKIDLKCNFNNLDKLMYLMDFLTNTKEIKNFSYINLERKFDLYSNKIYYLMDISIAF